ncbi:MAG: KpsF/GutQ family sugar-phosphate isomerase [Chitinophagaceae bacterium]|nr:KpsF/GutQ family sugar-phosphate isomerase [Chitinophagaceae bacterium]
MKLVKNIKSIAISVLVNEAKAIENLVNFINDDFEKCVLEILKCRGRVVITGIGKSAIIGNKIVATLNSTGTPSLFMHAADAIHGDLGMIQEQDIVICISKSGNTPEIKVLIPLLKRTGVKIIALISNVDSYLGQHADFILNATIEQEACPHNLAPTTSTTATMALGDALAVCLLECRNFTSGDFARLHPGGTLGKKLYLKVSDVYPNNALPVVKEDTSVEEVIMEISSKRLGATAVIGENQELKGIITDGDLRRMLTRKIPINGTRAAEIMSFSPKTIDEDEYAIDALELMRSNNITQLIVLKDNKVAGFIHLHDLLKEGLV